MVYVTKKKYQEFSMNMQRGDRSYHGAGHRRALRNSFSTSTMFPGIFVACLAINFVMTTLVFFIALVLLVTPIVLFALPGTRPLMDSVMAALTFPIISVGFKYILKVVIVDRMLVEHGQPIYPYLFAPLWVILILLNFVQAPFLGAFRY